MFGRMTLDLAPGESNPRNSEGAFALFPGLIVFAYSRYNSNSWDDDACADVAIVSSKDGGETWSEPTIIASAEGFGARNLMSVSAYPYDGGYVVLFLVKEFRGTTTLGRAFSRDGVDWETDRCRCNFIEEYYVINNDRTEVLSDGTVVIPAARHATSGNSEGFEARGFDANAVAVCLYSKDGGRAFYCAPARVPLSEPRTYSGMQEPGLLELKKGVLWMYARTDCGWQYECYSIDGMRTFTPPVRSRFSSPCSPMKVKRAPDGTLYSVWNPIPNYNGRKIYPEGGGRTPLVIARSKDDGLTWSAPVVIEDDEDRGYCYPAIEFLSDSILLAYCRGSVADKSCLVRTGIVKIPLADLDKALG